jgi:hypothetical protein
VLCVRVSLPTDRPRFETHSLHAPAPHPRYRSCASRGRTCEAWAWRGWCRGWPPSSGPAPRVPGGRAGCPAARPVRVLAPGGPGWRTPCPHAVLWRGQHQRWRWWWRRRWWWWWWWHCLEHQRSDWGVPHAICRRAAVAVWGGSGRRQRQRQRHAHASDGPKPCYRYICRGCLWICK